MTEAELQDAVIEAARFGGGWPWRVAHFRAAQTAKGWRTPVAADGAGFPDLILVRERTYAWELKSEKGRVSVDQQLWIDAFTHAGISARVVRPSDLPYVDSVLLARPPYSYLTMIGER